MNWDDIRSVHERVCKLNHDWTLTHAASDLWMISINGSLTMWTGRASTWEDVMLLTNNKLDILERLVNE